MENYVVNRDLIETINKLKSKLLDYCKTDAYILGNYSKAIVAAITIAISLAELKIFDNRDIQMKKNDGSKVNIK